MEARRFWATEVLSSFCGLLVFVLGSLPLMARTYTVLHTFDYTNGAYPFASLILSSNTLYGTTFGGGLGGGTVFKVNIDGTGFENLHNFSQTPPLFTDNADIPVSAGLILSGRTLYGTTSGNFAGDNGTVFAINIDGTGFTNLYSFSPTSASGTNYDGAHPFAALAFSEGKLYGTAALGGTSGSGTIFALNVDGSGFTTLYSFSGGQDGAQPRGGLVIQSNVLYGTTFSGGNGTGTIFGIGTDGTAFRTIYAFSPAPATGPYTTADGISPWATLTISGDTLYGTTEFGGDNYGRGTLFKVQTEGAGFTVLDLMASALGQQPSGGVILGNGVLYGTTRFGGNAGNGSIYSANVDGTDFNPLYSFPTSVDVHGWYPSSPIFITTNDYGALPFAGLVFSSNVLYGVTTSGGPMGYGVLYSLSLEQPPLPLLTGYLTNAWFGLGIELSAPTNVVGFPPIRIQESGDAAFTKPFFPGVPPDNRTNNGNVIGTYPLSSQGFFRLVQHW